MLLLESDIGGLTMKVYFDLGFNLAKDCTSVFLMYFPESTADSKKSLGGINIPNTVSKSFNRPPIILKFSGSEISMVVEISIGFDLLGIVEFQIYHFILPILQAHFGKKMAKQKTWQNITKVLIDF